MKGIYIYGVAYFSNGTSKTSREFRKQEAFSKWANKQFIIDEEVIIKEYEIDTDDNYSIRLVSTWSAQT